MVPLTAAVTPVCIAPICIRESAAENAASDGGNCNAWVCQAGFLCFSGCYCSGYDRRLYGGRQRSEGCRLVPALRPAAAVSSVSLFCQTVARGRGGVQEVLEVRGTDQVERPALQILQICADGVRKSNNVNFLDNNK